MDWLLSPEIWIALVTLTILEIVLGVDNIIFISILTDRCRSRGSGRRVGSAWRSRWSCGSVCCCRSAGSSD